MENSDQLIFKISSGNPKIFPYFARFANFINYMYTQYDNFSMIELFENGFLWIFRDAEHFRQSIQTFRDFRNNAPQELLEGFFHQFTENILQTYDFQPDEAIIFTIEFSDNIAEDLIPLLEDYFAFLSPGIHLVFQKGNGYLWEFDTPSDFAIFFGMVHFLDQSKPES